jgi:hypothetical protein
MIWYLDIITGLPCPRFYGLHRIPLTQHPPATRMCCLKGTDYLHASFMTSRICQWLFQEFTGQTAVFREGQKLRTSSCSRNFSGACTGKDCRSWYMADIAPCRHTGRGVISHSLSRTVCLVVKLALIRFTLQRSHARGVRLGLLGVAAGVANGLGCSWLSCRGFMAIVNGWRESE